MNAAEESFGSSGAKLVRLGVGCGCSYLDVCCPLRQACGRLIGAAEVILS
jgi:hypothetical protein